MRGIITSGKFIVMASVLFGLGGIGWAQTTSDLATASADAVQIQALAHAFQVPSRDVAALRVKHAKQGWGEVALQLAQAQPPAHRGSTAVPPHMVQVRALAQAFQVSPNVVEGLWATHATHGWGAVAIHLAQRQPAAQTDVTIASTER